MEQNPTLSIVVPVYNRANTIVRCLDSIAIQTGIGHCRIIVVDNNSSDSSAEIAANWHKHNQAVDMVLLHENRRGAAIARNTGMATADTPWIMFFDSDDIMFQGHLRRLLDAIGSRPDIDLFGWDISCQLPDKRYIKASFTDRHPLRSHLCKATLSTQRMAVRTELMQRVGGWDESLQGWDDYELGVRLLLAKPRIAKLHDTGHKPLVKTFFTEESITGSRYASKAHEWEAALDAIENRLNDSCPQMLCWVAFNRANLAGLYAREGALSDAKRLLPKARAKGFGHIKARIIYIISRNFTHGAHFASGILISNR